MNEASMNYFLETCERGSINKAAKALGITPQAVSKAIAALEGELGMRLLQRSLDGCSPTPDGQEVLKIAERMRRFNQEAMYQIRHINGSENECGTVKIGMPVRFEQIIPYSHFSDFIRLHPNSRIEVVSCLIPEACKAKICSGEIDLGYYFDAPLPSELVCIQEYATSAYLIVGARHRLAGKKRVSLQDLKGELFVCDASESVDYRKVMQEMEKAGINPCLTLPEMSDGVKRALVAEEGYVAISFCPAGWLPYGIVPVAIQEFESYKNVSYLCRLAALQPSQITQQYIRFIVPRLQKDIFGNLQREDGH